MVKKVAESAHAYTPGIKVKRYIPVRKLRRLPIKGEVLVSEGDKVSLDTVIARASLPGEPHLVKTFVELGVGPDEIERYMVKKEGDFVKEGEVLARRIAFFGLSKSFSTSPVDGFIEKISRITGQVIVREPPVPIEVKAYIPGKVVKVMPEEGAVIETSAAFVQGILGIGGETHGDLVMLAKTPNDVLTADWITNEEEGKILVGGSLIVKEALNKAAKLGVEGVIVGGIRDIDLVDFLGYEMGVAITGHEDVGLTLVITEGFGKMPMSERSFNLLQSFEGFHASMNGATQIRAGVIRPEVIIPHVGTGTKGATGGAPDYLEEGLTSGTLVRLIREPHFGAIGRVISLPVELQKIETESYVRVLEVELENGERVVMPRANVEIIEE